MTQSHSINDQASIIALLLNFNKLILITIGVGLIIEFIYCTCICTGIFMGC